MNTLEALANVNRLMAELEGTTRENRTKRVTRIRWDIRTDKCTYAFKIDEIFDEVGIFDWWGSTLSMSQLKQMKNFLTTAHKLGFDGYVCFKVGATGCSHGMWAHKEESTTGYSPETGDVLFHSFRCGDCYWDVCHNDKWMGDHSTYKFNLKQVKAELAKA